MANSGHSGPSARLIKAAFNLESKVSTSPVPPQQPEAGSFAVQTLRGAFFWRRVFARSIDFILIMPLGVLLYIPVYIAIEIVRSVTAPSYFVNFAVDLVVGHILLLTAILLHDSVSLASLGTTLGKAIFGIHVRQANGRKMSFIQAIKRTERMLRSHYYLLGFPVIMWVFVAASFSHIKRNGSAIWDDQTKSVLSVRPIGPLRRVVAGVLGLVVLAALVVADRVAKNQTKEEFDEELSKIYANKTPNRQPQMNYDVACYPSWETVSVPGICTFQIPPTMELQAGTCREFMDKFRNRVHQVTASDNHVVAQPKGMNDRDPDARGKYARIIVITQSESYGTYGVLGDPLTLSNEELNKIDGAIKEYVGQEATQAAKSGLPPMTMRLLSWGGTRVVRINNLDCLLTEYSRSLNNAPPVSVRRYTFMNNDRMHLITVSYRTKEADMWADDLDKFIKTIKFEKR